MLIQIPIFCTGAAILSHLNQTLPPPNKPHPLINILGGLIATGCYHKFGPELRTIIVFAFLTILTVIAITDIATMKIPNELVAGVTITAIISIHFFPEIPLLSRFTGFISVSGILFLITLIVPGSFGGGDIKLMAASGLFLGAYTCLTAFIIAILSAGAYIILLLLLATRKTSRKDHIAFGPFLCIGIAIAIFYGEQFQHLIF